ncbi:MAG: NupC/NupG family nucleoside CNT transporter [Microscillaceae bacterium]|nr:NupC/NupG family nucleoside CNT transporter [Microscillaceae bacterium]
MAFLQGLLGLAFFIGLGYVFSINRRAIDWRLVLIGVVLQISLALLILEVSFVQVGFKRVSEGFVTFLDFSRYGSEFLFGDLAKNSRAYPDAKHSLGLIVAFQVLPVIIFFATVTAGLYYLGILQKVVYVIAWVMARTMRLSGPESLSAAGNIFLGQTEAPLLVKPFIPQMTNSELMCLMTGGMATIAGSVLAAYVSFLGGDDPVLRAEAAANLLTASIMNAPAAVVMAKMMVPQTQPERIQRELNVSKESLGVNLIDALSQGAGDGLRLALNVGGMLLAFIALIAMLNYMLGSLGEWLGLNSLINASTGGAFPKLSMEYILGQLVRPLAWAMGVAWDQTLLMGSLLGKKTAVNEFVAYADLAQMKANGQLSPHTILIATYALCGFSNFSSIAIQIGGISVMAPNQQSNLSKLGLRALLAASLACMMTATIAGVLAG